MSERTTKNCKHCMTEIHRRARICPQCQQPLTFLSGLKKLLANTAWLLTTLISLGVAARENMKKQEYASLAHDVLGLQLRRDSDTEAPADANDISLPQATAVPAVPESLAAEDDKAVELLQSKLENVEVQLANKLKNFAFDPATTKELVMERETIMREIARARKEHRLNHDKR